MLLLTRNVYEDKTIIIQTTDGDIIISIEGVKGGQVRVGIDAPDNVGIWRSELLDKEIAA